MTASAQATERAEAHHPLIATAADVTRTLDMRTCIGLMKQALIALAGGDARQIVRPVLPLEGHNVLGMMPAFAPEAGVAGVKVLSVYPSNFEKNIASHQGCIVVFDADTGALKAIVDAEAVTAIRTAAASAAVTDVLARADASRLAILGAGLQGRRHLEAISLVRDLSEVTVWDLRPEAAARYAREMSASTGLPVRSCDSAREAVQDADIICTVTPSRTPILFADDVRPGTHVNAVGACTPDAREIGADLMAMGKLYVDWQRAALVEAGDFVLARQEGVLSEEDILAEVGSVLSGATPGRTGPGDVTIFEALGQGLQDLLAANHVANALEREALQGDFPDKKALEEALERDALEERTRQQGTATDDN